MAQARQGWAVGVLGVFLLGATAAVAGARIEEQDPLMERSGFLLARPIQEQDWVRSGVPESEARARRQRALELVRPIGIGVVPELDLHRVRCDPETDERDLSQRLIATGLFEYVEPDWIVYPADHTPNDPYFALQWHLQRISAPRAWDTVTGDPDVVIAVVDTGVELDHPDLVDVLVPGYNAVDRVRQADGGLVDDINGHGTGVAGAAAASGNNGVGISGVGWDLSVMPIRVTNVSGGSAVLSDIIHGVIWGAQHGAKVVTVSYVGVFSDSAQVAGEYVRDAGGLLVWAADDADMDYDWFDHEDVLIVGGISESDEKVSTSSYGRAIDLVAPALHVMVTRTGRRYAFRSGNSYAAPQVAGAAALVWSGAPDLDSRTVEQVLLDSADDLGDPGEDDLFGRGVVDVGRAVESLGPGPDDGTGGSNAHTARMPDHPDRLADGLLARYYDVHDPDRVPDFADLVAYAHGLLPNIDFPFSRRTFAGAGTTEDLAVLIEGYFHCSRTGLYTFALDSDDGSRMWIGDELVVDNDGRHFMREAEGSILLAAGDHQMRIGFFSDVQGAGLILRYESPWAERQVVPDKLLAFAPHAADFNADGFIDSRDLVSFFVAFVAADPAADINGDGFINTADVIAFFNIFLNADGY